MVDKRKHNYGTIKNILRSYKKIYEDNFVFSNENDKNNCNYFVFQRDSPYLNKKSGNIKDGIHIMNPGFRAIPSVHLNMREMIIKDDKLINTFKSLNCLNTIDDIVDKNIIDKNSWCLYGSSKPDKKPYTLKYVFDFDLNEKNIDDLNIKSYSKYLSYWNRDLSSSSISTNYKKHFYK